MSTIAISKLEQGNPSISASKVEIFDDHRAERYWRLVSPAADEREEENSLLPPGLLFSRGSSLIAFCRPPERVAVQFVGMNVNRFKGFNRKGFQPYIQTFEVMLPSTLYIGSFNKTLVNGTYKLDLSAAFIYFIFGQRADGVVEFPLNNNIFALPPLPNVYRNGTFCLGGSREMTADIDAGPAELSSVVYESIWSSLFNLDITELPSSYYRALHDEDNEERDEPLPVPYLMEYIDRRDECDGSISGLLQTWEKLDNKLILNPGTWLTNDLDMVDLMTFINMSREAYPNNFDSFVNLVRSELCYMP